ncbi:MAG TPA: response regulator [Stellaceae bacterium]|jgi:DNA-binding response OmpR family regulator
MPEQSDNRRPPKILIVEDNTLVAETIAEALMDSGYEVVGPAPTLSAGMELAVDADLDGALLDVDLAGRMCFPIAAILAKRKVPFLFLTGYHDASVIPPELRWAWRLTKPFHLADLDRVTAKAFGGAPA